MRQENFGAHRLQQVTSEVSLVKGFNRLLVRLDQVVEGPTPFAFALKVGGVDSLRDPLRLQLRLPTGNPNFQKQKDIESLAQRAYIERDSTPGQRRSTSSGRIRSVRSAA